MKSFSYIAVFAVLVAAVACGGSVFAAGADAWAGAGLLSGMTGSDTGSDNETASAELGEPFAVNGDNKTLWWKWMPSSGTRAFFDTYGSDFDTVIGVYTGSSVDALEEVAYNDVRFLDRTSGVSFNVTPGTTYYICVSGHKDNFGKINLNWNAVDNDFSFIEKESGTLVGFVGGCPEVVTIPDEIKTISMSAFDHDHDASVADIKTFVIPGGVTNIGQYAFNGCTNLSSVTFTNGLETISYNAFQHCTSLRDIDLPVTATDVTDESFNNMDGTVTVKAPRSLVGMLNDGSTVGTTTLNVIYYINVTLDPGEGTLDEASKTFAIVGRDIYGELPVPARAGYEFTGWSQGSKIIDKDTALPNVAAVTLTAQWSVKTIEVTFDANGGKGGGRESLEYDTPLGAPDVVKEGYSLLGWAPELPDTVPTTNATYVAQWDEVKVLIFLDIGDGTVTKETFSFGTKVDGLTKPTREGYVFDGWYTKAADEGGEKLSDDTVLVDGMVLYAHWNEGGSGGGDEPQPTPAPVISDFYLCDSVVDEIPQTSASTYDGYLYSEEGEMKGVILVKVGKPNKNTNLASVSATVQVIGQKKITLKAENRGKAEIAAGAPTTVTMVGGEACSITLGYVGMAGRYGAYKIDGVRNVFVSKDRAEQDLANAALRQWLGAINIAWKGGALSVNISAKGKAKVSGTLADGTKVSGVNSRLAIGTEWCCVPVSWMKKNHSLSFTLWLGRRNGLIAVVGLDNYVAGRPENLNAGAAFRIDKTAAEWARSVKTEYLPDGVSVEQRDTKWIVAGGEKSGKVTYLRGTTEIDVSKLGNNPSGLKLNYKAKDGSFKGSFKTYADVGGKLKATTVNVTGVMVEGVGYGIATIKRTGVSIDVAIK